MDIHREVGVALGVPTTKVHVSESEFDLWVWFDVVEVEAGYERVWMFAPDARREGVGGLCSYLSWSTAAVDASFGQSLVVAGKVAGGWGCR